MNRKNLEKHGRFMANLSGEDNRNHFDMGDWVHRDNTSIADPEKILEFDNGLPCGTTACGVGYIPIVFPELFVKHVNDYGSDSPVRWHTLANEVFEIGPYFQFLFSAFWSSKSDRFQRTSWALADRIAFLLYCSEGTDLVSLNYDEIDTEYSAVSAGWINIQIYEQNMLTARNWDWEHVRADFELDHD
jgi:hypothetical protein